MFPLHFWQTPGKYLRIVGSIYKILFAKKEVIPATSFPAGCFDSSPETFPSLFYCDTCRSSDLEVYYAPFQTQRLMVLSSLDVIYILDLTSYPRWNSSWLVDMSIWKNFSFAILALCHNHIVFTSYLFLCYVFNRDQTNDVCKTWNSDWRLK